MAAMKNAKTQPTMRISNGPGRKAKRVFISPSVAGGGRDSELRYTGGHAEVPPLRSGDVLLRGERRLLSVVGLESYSPGQLSL
jgi:hypothetical protein